MQHAIETSGRANEDRAVLEGVRWCNEHGATVRWRGDPAHPADDPDDMACVVEVLAPGTNWNLLRGCGAGFIAAYEDVRAKHDAWAREVLLRPRAPNPDPHRWSA